MSSESTQSVTAATAFESGLETGTRERGNKRFQNALARRPQPTPPIWLMRQAGRYHRHYQALRAKYSFVDLCKQPELAAEVALGPIADFGFDAAILFSDLLFPLQALGIGLEYTERGPQLGWQLNEQTISELRSVDDAWPELIFQGEAVRITRERLPADRSLIGFVGGPWTLFVYAVEGTHKGSLVNAKKLLPLFPRFCESIVPLLVRSIQSQIDNGAEVVMVFDTAAGELSPDLFQRAVLPQLRLLQPAGQQIGYYSKGTQAAHLRNSVFANGAFAGIGVDHGWDIRQAFELFPHGFVQGNFDQALLHAAATDLKQYLHRYLNPLKDREWPGWICGLGHGVLPGTPEDNVRLFVETIRETLR